LLALNDAERAATEGRIYLRAAEEAEIGYAVHYIDMPLAVAEAKLGDADAASRRADQVIADFQRLECQGVNLGLAYETRARVALYAGDRDNAEAYIGRAASVLRASQSRTAKARHLRLQQELREQFGDVDTAAGAGLELSTQAGFTSLISTMMHKCETAEARAHQGLSILIAHSQSSGKLRPTCETLPALQFENDLALAPLMGRKSLNRTAVSSAHERQSMLSTARKNKTISASLPN
jgi:hypothetical protein